MIENLKTMNNEEENELDLSQLYKIFKKNIRLIVITAIIGAIISVVITVFFIEKKYASETRIYLTPKVSDQGIVDNTTISSNNLLVNSYVSIMQGKNILTKVADDLNLSSVAEVSNSLTVTNEKDTQIISVVAKTDNPTKSKQIAETTVEIFFTEMKDKLQISNMTIVDAAELNAIEVSPSKKKNLLVGTVAGGFLAASYVVIKFLLDKRLRNRSEVENFLEIPVLVEVPFFDKD
ncbi:MAG: Wzz/FepE/Etk N-terminal domain-containing protein [Erysipelotrichaceae bacterium]